MIWWGIGALMLFLLIRHLWRTYNHPTTVLGRQAANMNWVARGTAKDSRGYRNTRFVRGGVEVELSFSPVEVRLVKPFQPQAFPDFLALERWLGAKEDENHDTIADLDDDGNSDTFYGQVEKQIALRGYSQSNGVRSCKIAKSTPQTPSDSSFDPSQAFTMPIVSVDQR